MLEKRKVKPGDEILYCDVEGKVQNDGRIKHSSKITGDAYFIDAVAFATNFAKNFARNLAINLFATCYRCDDDDKVQSLEELLSSCDSIGASGGGGGGGPSGEKGGEGSGGGRRGGGGSSSGGCGEGKGKRQLTAISGSEKGKEIHPD